MDLATLEEIRQVKYRYLRCVDTKLWDEIGDTFTADATVDYGTQAFGKPLKMTGRDEIVAFFRDNVGPDILTVHAAGQPEITVDGDTRPASGPSRTRSSRPRTRWRSSARPSTTTGTGGKQTANGV